MVHRNAPLSETGRLRLARCDVEEGWTLRRAAERFQVAVTTAQRWAARNRELGPAGMVDRSSRPHRSPYQTPTRTERRIIKVRVIRRWGPAQIGYLLGIHPSTVHRVLTRYGVARLRCSTDPLVGSSAGSNRRLSAILFMWMSRSSARFLPVAGNRNAQAHRGPGQHRDRHLVRGYYFLHTAIDGHSRLVYSEMLNFAPNTHAGYTPTITTAATPHSAANHPPAAYLTWVCCTDR